MGARGQFDEAITTYARLYAKLPKPEWEQALGELYSLSGDTRLAHEWKTGRLAIILSRFPCRGPLPSFPGRVMLRTGGSNQRGSGVGAEGSGDALQLYDSGRSCVGELSQRKFTSGDRVGEQGAGVRRRLRTFVSPGSMHLLGRRGHERERQVMCLSRTTNPTPARAYLRRSNWQLKRGDAVAHRDLQ